MVIIYAILSVVESHGVADADGDGERRPAQDEAQQHQEQHAGHSATLRHLTLLDGAVGLAGASLQLSIEIGNNLQCLSDIHLHNNIQQLHTTTTTNTNSTTTTTINTTPTTTTTINSTTTPTRNNTTAAFHSINLRKPAHYVHF